MIDKKDSSYFENMINKIEKETLLSLNSKKDFDTIKRDFRTTMVYIILGGVWIVGSDKILKHFVKNPSIFSEIQVYKEWFYVFLTGAIFYFITRKKGALLKKNTDKMYESYEELSATHEELIAMEEEINQQYNELEKKQEALVISDQRYQLVVEGSNDGIWEWYLENDAYLFYVKWKSIFGYGENELVKTLETFQELLHPDDVERTMKNIESYLVSGEGIYEDTYRLKCKDGKYRWVLSRGKGVWDCSGNIIRVAGSHTDITEVRKVQEKLHQKSELLDNIIEKSTVLIIIIDTKGNIKSMNYSAEVLIGYKKEQIIGKSIVEIISPELKKEALEISFHEILTGKALKDGEVPLLCRDGHTETVLWNTILNYDQKGNAKDIVFMGMNITERRNMEKSLYRLAYYDVLTGLPNRVLFEKEMQRLIERAKVKKNKMAVVYIDIDNFKNVNGSIGHAKGDQLLLDIAKILSHHIKSTNSVARLGGDEFGILLTEGIENEEIDTTVNAILQFLKRPWILENQEFFISISIGIAVYPEHGTDVGLLMQNADTALFHVKENGKNGYGVYNSNMREKTLEYTQMNNQLIHAIENEEFSLYYQPQMDLKTNKLVGVEALIRWFNPEIGFVPPMDFIPFAEETGHIFRISEWVLKTACEQTKIWKEKGYDIKIAVNLSGKLLAQKDLVGTIQNTLKEYSVKACEIELEITETAIMVDLKNSVKILENLKEFGVSISLDDFGTGYSSLTYLQKLPIDILKMDRDFIKNVTDPNEACFIFKTVIELAHNLGLKVIAEGVETKEQLEFLTINECDIAQGYYFSKPVPAPELEAFFEKMI